MPKADPNYSADRDDATPARGSAKTRLTDEMIRRLVPPARDRREIFDSKAPGLALRITSLGARSWCVYYQHHGKRTRYTIGKFELYDVKAARDRARAVLREVDDGGDPMAAKRSRLAPLDPDKTVKAAVDRWLAEEVSQNRASTQHEWRRIFDKDILPSWGKRALASITEADVFALRDAVFKRGAEVQSNRVLLRVGRFFNWAVGERLLPASPAANVPKRGKETARDRVLTDDEIKWFWQATGEIGEPFNRMFKLLLVTAQRRDEVTGLALPELDLAQRQWTIPGERAKNAKAHTVGLSDLAVELIAEAQKDHDNNAVTKRSPLLFTTNGETAPSGFSRAKLRLDATMENFAREAKGCPTDDEEYRKHLGLKPRAPLPRLVPDWVLHDLRRTAATGMARLNVPPHVVDRILNHTAGTIRGVAAVYNRFAYDAERRDALAAWARFLTDIIEGRSGGNVVRLDAVAR